MPLCHVPKLPSILPITENAGTPKALFLGVRRSLRYHLMLLNGMNKVRLGIIGMGNMGKFHADYLLANKVARCELTCFTEPSGASRERYKQLQHFDSAEKLIRSGQADAVIIATPHFSHTTIGLDALEHGLHILVEKPISVHKADCERLIEKARSRKQVFAAMFQLRTDPKFKKLKSLLERKELGRITRVNWIITDWFRTEAYYASGGWRATWRGEGGGVLLNQCPHNIDLLLWLCGLPSKIRGFCQLGRYHDIEVEDQVTAYLEWPSGATGVFITSTGEAPGTNRFEIVGEMGKVVLEANKIIFTRNEVSMLDFSRSSKAGFARPDIWTVDIPFENTGPTHEAVVQNFVDSILDGVPLIAPGSEGIHSVEFANAVLYSSLQGATITLPLDSKAYEKQLQELIAGSKLEKKVVRTNEDFTKSFNR